MKYILSLVFASLLLMSSQSKANLIEFTFESYILNTLSPSGVTYGSFVFDYDDLIFSNSSSYNSTIKGSDLIAFNFSYDDSSNGNGVISFGLGDVNPIAVISLFTPLSVDDYDLQFSTVSFSTILTNYTNNQTPYFHVQGNSMIHFGGLSAVNFFNVSHSWWFLDCNGIYP